MRFRQFWGVTKRAELVASLYAGQTSKVPRQDFDAEYKLANPETANRFSFRPSTVSVVYRQWPRLVDISACEPFNGPIERRGNSLIVFESEKSIFNSLKAYLDASRSDEEIRAIEPRFMKSSGDFNAERARRLLRGRVQYDPARIVRYPFKPFDIRLAYLDPAIHPLFSRPSPELLDQRLPGNKFLIARENSVVEPTSPPLFFSSLICDYHTLAVEAKHIPLRLQSASASQTIAKQITLFAMDTAVVANLSSSARAYLAALGIPDPDDDAEIAPGLRAYELIWLHALAIGYAPAYLRENADGIRGDWPRIPLPTSRDALLVSAALGQQVAALLDTERPVPGVTQNPCAPEIKPIAVLARVGGGSLNPTAGDLDITAGWGHAGKEGVTMPGRGRVVERPRQTFEVSGTSKVYRRQQPSTSTSTTWPTGATCRPASGITPSAATRSSRSGSAIGRKRYWGGV